ncbi:MAG: glycosyl transferase family 1 [Rhizobiales bacterium]|nr:glycosyl transferase family 1 [Hyphomicrobiales bacterium]MBA67419.1 glycosyl transferase family 1 [Hyphomicrobiales bacterium]
MNKPVISFFPEASFGSALNCVGIAQKLQRQGAVPVFLCHQGFTGVFNEYGFKEYQLPATRKADNQRSEESWQAFINAHLEHFNQDPTAQIESYVGPTWNAIVDTAIQAEQGLESLLKRIKPDAIVLDNVIMFPAIANAGVPWIRVVSCAETEIPDPNVPPYLSGLAAGDPARSAFEKAYLEVTAPIHARYNRFRAKRGLEPLPPGQFLETSPWLNLLLAPRSVRRERAEALPEDSFVFLEGCVREEAQFDPPPLPVNEGPIIYLSFGSLGAIDTDLIGRMIDVFATFPARFYVNVGGFLESYQRVPNNVYLGSWFPQPSIVAQSDLFIHHGGNNSFCEALYYGVPSICMPYCWDGHDNGLRTAETGIGIHLKRDSWTPDQLREAMASLLQDHEMRERLQRISRDMVAADGSAKAADEILRVIPAS